MNGANSTWLKPIAWMLLAALLGVYLLYDWYTDRLDAQLAEKETRISEILALLQDRDARIGPIQGEVAQLKARLAEQASELSKEKQQLGAQVAAAELRHAQLEDDMQALRRTHAEALGAERAKVAQAIEEREQRENAYRELHSLFEEAQEQIVTLKRELAGLQQAIAESAAEHREQVAELERHLNERVRLAKATPKDAELMRAAQAAGLLPPAAAVREEDQDLADQLAETQASLQALQTEYEAARGEYREQIATLEEALADARAQPARPGGHAAAAMEMEKARAAYAEQLATAESRIGALTERLRRSYTPKAFAALRERLERTESELAQVRAAAAAAGEKAGAAQAEQLAAAESRIGALTERVRQSFAPDAVALLQARLAQAELELGRVRSEADAAVAEARADGDRRAEAGQAKLAALSERLATEQAEAAKREADQDAVIAEVKDALSRAEQELSAARGDAGDEARARIAELEAAVEEERRQSGQAQSALRAEAEQAVSRLRGLYQRFSELGGTYTARGMLLKLADTELRFPTGTATLTDADLPSLDRIASLLADHPNLEARIEGHTDSLGDEETNLALSQERAEAVKAALIERGVDPARLSAEGVGPARPIADNSNPAGRAQNRRVEVYVSEE